ncbi:hypothetical protein F5H01DRAFT_340804, partial [Linnemannia elongata]
MFLNRLLMKHLALILVVAIHAAHALYCDRPVGSVYDPRTSVYLPDDDGRSCEQFFKDLDNPNHPTNVAYDKDAALRNNPVVKEPLDKCLAKCHLDLCLKQESIKQDYKGCRTNCPAWNDCMKSQECSLAAAFEGDCERKDCIATDLCGNDCVMGNTEDLSGLADEKCSCVNECRVSLGFSPADCKYSKMYKDCTTFLKTGKA